MKSNVEVDFKRLLSKCQKLITSYPDNGWRLEKYVATLDQMKDQLELLKFFKPSREDLMEYSKQINYFKGIIHVNKLNSPAEKLMAAQILSPNTSVLNNSIHNKTLDLYLHSQAIYSKEIRDDLLGYNKLESKSNLKANLSKHEIDLVLKENEKTQDKIAEEMVLLARNLKQNLVIANKIIKSDTMALENTSNLADRNTTNLKTNNDYLDKFVRRSCQYWLWIIAAIVSITFILVAWFIKFFPKKYY